MADHDLVLALAHRFRGEAPEVLAEAFRRLPTFQGDLTWLERLLEAAEDLPLPEVPPAVSAAVHDLMPPDDHVRIEDAATLHDSRSSRVLVGSRDDGSGVDGWTMTASAPSADIVVDGLPTGDGEVTITGQLLARSTSLDTATIKLTGTTESLSRSDAIGAFSLGTVPPGSYHLSARTPDYVIRFDFEVTS